MKSSVLVAALLACHAAASLSGSIRMVVERDAGWNLLSSAQLVPQFCPNKDAACEASHVFFPMHAKSSSETSDRLGAFVHCAALPCKHAPRQVTCPRNLGIRTGVLGDLKRAGAGRDRPMLAMSDNVPSWVSAH